MKLKFENRNHTERKKKLKMGNLYMKIIQKSYRRVERRNPSRATKLGLDNSNGKEEPVT
jgi:hypothetical protein